MKKSNELVPFVALPVNGRSRWGQVKQFIPVSREKFRLLYLEGKAPQPERLGCRITFYENAEIHRWLNDPVGYVAPGFSKASNNE